MLRPLTLHYARWAIINNDSQLLYAATFDTDFDKYAEDAHRIFLESGFSNFFEHMEDFPDDWKTNIPAFVKFFKDRHVPSIFEFAGYPDVSVVEVKKALKTKQAFSEILDQMQ